MLVSGSLPPEVCGVGDYTAALARSLRQQGLAVDTHRAASGRQIVRALRALRRPGYDLVHLQYPSVGYGKSFWPHLLAATSKRRTRVVLTLHEYQAAHIARRAAAIFLAGLSDQLIFTENADRTRWPLRGGQAAVVPIGSNMPVAPPTDPQVGRVIYFGLLRPRRGLETFLEVARRARELNEPFTFEVIGAVDEKRRAYAKQMVAAHPDVIWTLGLPAGEVAARITRATAAYLPYPDGATGRRGSLLAVLENSVPVLTTRGPDTPVELERCVVMADSQKSALEALRSIPERRLELAARAGPYLQAHSWQSIGLAHKDLYEKILEGANP